MKHPLWLLPALLFAWSAYVQWNDPDPVVWILAYGAVAACCALAAFGRRPRAAITVLLAGLVVWMLWLSPGFVQWLGMGAPSIVEEMKATAPHIEVVREFLGLLIAVAVLALLRFTGRKR
jgi:NO-binding membrane sensor protein with MHYT domain